MGIGSGNRHTGKMTLPALAGPIFMENLLRMTLGNVNIFILAHYSTDAVSAVGPANDAVRMLLMIFGIIAIGASVTLNQFLGNGKEKEAKQVTAVALSATLAIGFFTSIMMSVFAGPILHMLNLPHELMGMGQAYLRIVGLGLFTQSITASLSAISRSNGLSKFPMYMALLTNVLNLAGNVIVLEHPFGMPQFGVPGVAISLVISEFISMVILIGFLIRAGILRFKLADILPFRFKLLGQVLGIGLPSAGEFISFNAAQLASTAVVASLGASALATKIVVQNVVMFVYVIGLSIGQATMILVGHAIGADKPEEAGRMAFRNVKIAMAVDVVMAVLLAVCGHFVLKLYLTDPAQIRMGQILLFVSIAMQPGRDFNLVVANALRGAGDVRYPVGMGVISMWGISVLMSYVLGIVLHLGLVGVWIAFASDEWARGLIMLFRWRSGRWREFSLVRGKHSLTENAGEFSDSGSGRSSSTLSSAG